MNTADAYEIAARWHDKQAAHCKAVELDDPRIGPAIRDRAKQARIHHEGSAAGLRNSATQERRKRL